MLGIDHAEKGSYVKVNISDRNNEWNKNALNYVNRFNSSWVPYKINSSI